MGARRRGRDPNDAPRPDMVDLVAQPHRQLAACDEIELLDLVVGVSGALLEVGVRRYPDQCRGNLRAAKCIGEAAKLPWDVGALVGVADLIRMDDREIGGPIGHRLAPTPVSRAQSRATARLRLA